MKVRIYKPHIHAGEQLEPGPEGIEIDVAPAEAEFLKQRGFTKPASGTPVPTKVSAARTASEPQA